MWYNGAKALGTRGAGISLGTFGKVLCCGRAAFLVKTDYDPVGGLQAEPEDSQGPKENSIKRGIAWTNRNPDTCKRVGVIVTGELKEFANGSVN